MAINSSTMVTGAGCVLPDGQTRTSVPSTRVYIYIYRIHIRTPWRNPEAHHRPCIYT